jgi:hypothetical protein
MIANPKTNQTLYMALRFGFGVTSFTKKTDFRNNVIVTGNRITPSMIAITVTI